MSIQPVGRTASPDCRDGLSDFARDRIATIRAERQRFARRRDEAPMPRGNVLREIVPFGAEQARIRDLINGRNAAETLALVGLISFLILLLVAHAVFGDDVGMADAVAHRI